jgi:hypothetical protein
MNGRLYDPIIASFLSPDPYVQMPNFTQSFNRYAYCWNNPLSYTDPDGEFITIAVIIGAAIGAYSGYKIAQAKGLDFGDFKTWAYMVGGAVIGGVAGGIGGAIAASSMPFANTFSLAASSFINSVGMSCVTGMPLANISIGAASYDLTSGKFNYLGKKGNGGKENLGYGLGSLANIQDIISLYGGGTNYDVNASETKTEWWGHSSGTGEGIDISVGPGINNHSSKMDFFKTISGERWSNYADTKGTWTIKLGNVNQKILQSMSKNIQNGKGLIGGNLKWNLFGYSCVNHVSTSLWAVGIPTLPINFHPYILNTQLMVRQAAIYYSPNMY